MHMFHVFMFSGKCGRYRDAAHLLAALLNVLEHFEKYVTRFYLGNPPSTKWLPSAQLRQFSES
jgi:hypothetical protein